MPNNVNARYCERLSERARRRAFVLERDLANAGEREKKMTNQKEKSTLNDLRGFARFHSAEEHQALE